MSKLSSLPLFNTLDKPSRTSTPLKRSGLGSLVTIEDSSAVTTSLKPEVKAEHPVFKIDPPPILSTPSPSTAITAVENKIFTPEELDKVKIPKKCLKTDNSRSRSAPRSRVNFEVEAPVNTKWSETLVWEKNRESYIVELMSCGYHIISFLEIEDFDKQKKYYALCSTPRGFYVFCRLPKITKPDESWIQIKHPKYENQHLIQDIIDQWIGKDKFQGFIGLSDKAFCYTDNGIAKFYQMIGKPAADNLSRIKTGDYYFVPIAELSQIVKDPGDVQNQIFDTIKQLRIRTLQSNQDKIDEIEQKQARFRENLELLKDNLVKNTNVISNVREKWNTSSDRKFFVKMDVLISSNSESCYRSFCEINRKIFELNQDLDRVISDITVNSEKLKLLTDDEK